MDVYQKASEWLRLDRDPATRAEISNLVAQGNTEELQQRLSTRISFGTAGARARDEAGFARINSLTVIQITQGLATFLLESNAGESELKALIGYDGRRNSKRYAETAAAAFVAKGIFVELYGCEVHTPLVAFGVKVLRAHVGVMITASHNPAEDNGYKVYGAKGTQIDDVDARAIQSSISHNLEPLAWKLDHSRLLPDPFSPVCEAYFSCISRSVILPSLKFPVVYTPLHGVGLRFLLGAMSRCFKDEANAKEMREPLNAGLWKHLKCVKVPHNQALPDPDFPTVKYPNPEEHGALDIAKTVADAQGLQVVIATDPDADRFAAAQKVGTDWYIFKGDEMGVLLGHYVWEKISKTSGRDGVFMLTSTVSSQMLGAIGRTEGFDVEETLTGFKWIGNRALHIELTGRSAVFGYEEALGYMNPQIAYDKDGISAASMFLEACLHWSSSPFNQLQTLYEKYGYYVTTNTYWRSPSPAVTLETFSNIQRKSKAVLSCFGSKVNLRIRDLSTGTDTGTQDGKSDLPSSPSNLMITFWLDGEELEDGARCTIRASGTEPKIKGKTLRSSLMGSANRRFSLRGMLQQS